MEVNKKVHLVTLITATLILFLTLVSSAALASPTITETRITSSGSAFSPAIYGSKIVWQDWTNDPGSIYVQDLSTKKQVLITNLSDGADSIEIYGDKVVLTSWSALFAYDLSTSKYIKTPDELAGFSAIYGNSIVYSPSMVSGNIYMYDLSTKKQTQITTSESAEDPAIFGKRIVWTDYRNENPDIYMYDLSTKKETQITKSGMVRGPAIYDNRVVWTDYRNGNADIYMYNLSTKKETQITTNPSDSENPVIYGNSIVWQDNRNGNWDIYAFDLITHQQIHTPSKSDQIEPAIYGNKVVWTTSHNEKSDIYMGTLKYK